MGTDPHIIGPGRQPDYSILVLKGVAGAVIFDDLLVLAVAYVDIPQCAGIVHIVMGKGQIDSPIHRQFKPIEVFICIAHNGAADGSVRLYYVS